MRSKWAVGKAVRAGVAVGGRIQHQFARRAVKLVLVVTDEQRGRRPIFNAILRAAASWLLANGLKQKHSPELRRIAGAIARPWRGRTVPRVESLYLFGALP